MCVLRASRFEVARGPWQPCGPQMMLNYASFSDQSVLEIPESSSVFVFSGCSGALTDVGPKAVSTPMDPPARCPGCSLWMRRAKVRSIAIDVCPGCRGIWFDTGELETCLGRTFGRRMPHPHRGR